jgi:hypothetical protein
MSICTIVFFYGNIPRQATLAETPEEPSTLGINYSLIQDGENGIYNNGGVNFIEWREGNMDSDPFFFGSGEHPYSIDYGSPCIDAGTTDLPSWIDLPEFDIAGNPRVYGDGIDMGAYEYGPWVGVPPVGGRRSTVGGQVLISPNPFSYGTYISYDLEVKGKLKISIYNSNGLHIRTLANYYADPGEKAEIYWDGRDAGAHPLPPRNLLFADDHRRQGNGNGESVEGVVISHFAIPISVLY